MILKKTLLFLNQIEFNFVLIFVYLQEKEELEKQLSQYKEDIDVSETNVIFVIVIIIDQYFQQFYKNMESIYYCYDVFLYFFAESSRTEERQHPPER